MFEYEDDDKSEYSGVDKYRRPYNPDKLNEYAVNQEIHGRRYKPMSDTEFYRRDKIYEDFMKVTKKSNKVKNTK